MEPGDILGHEFMGIVEEVGSDVKNVKKGDRCVACFDMGCGKCFYCQRGLYSCCMITNPSNMLCPLYGHKTGGFFGGLASMDPPMRLNLADCSDTTRHPCTLMSQLAVAHADTRVGLSTMPQSLIALHFSACRVQPHHW